MKKKRAQRKRETLEGIAASIQQFYPEVRGVFVCPTCLGRTAIADVSEVSEAHILPQASGGRLATFLCRTCNSNFGRIQDKWFGEYLRLQKAPGPLPSFLHANHQEGHYEIAGQRVNGRYSVSDDGEIHFLVWPHKNSPHALKALDQIAADARQPGGSLDVTIRVPLLLHEAEITCGFITAAYLLWFRELGYSWAFQEHLEIVRKQIASPGEAVLPKSATAVCTKEFFEHPWIGTGAVAGELALVAGLANRLVFFPPVDRPGFYESLPSTLKGLRVGGRQVTFGWQRLGFPGPVAVVFGERLVVAPDTMVRCAVSAPVIVVPLDGGVPRTLYPISEEECARRLAHPSARHVRIKPNVRLPPKDTGR